MKKLLVKYKLVYTKNAFKDIKKLDPVVKKRIKKKVEFYSQKPVIYGKRLLKRFLGCYNWRIGNYRIIFDIKGKNIIILRIGHRKEVYK